MGWLGLAASTWENIGIGLATGGISGLITGFITGNKVTAKFTKKEHQRQTLSALSNAFYNLLTLDIYLSEYKSAPSPLMRDKIESHLYSLVADFRNISNSSLFSYSKEGGTDIQNTEGFLTGLMNKFSNGNIPGNSDINFAIQSLGGSQGNVGFKSKILNEMEILQGYRK